MVLWDGDIDILVVIDVVVCGFDVEWILYVFNYDILYDIEFYVYWIGCIGRVGCLGVVLIFVLLWEFYLFKVIEKVMW